MADGVGKADGAADRPGVAGVAGLVEQAGSKKEKVRRNKE
jgi:hypothetical protein